MQAQAHDAMQSHEVNLMGRDFRIRSSDDGEHVEHVAAYVNAKIRDIQSKQRHAPIQSVLLLAAMDMADELLKERAQHDAMKERIRDQSRALLSRLGA